MYIIVLVVIHFSTVMQPRVFFFATFFWQPGFTKLPIGPCAWHWNKRRHELRERQDYQWTRWHFTTEVIVLRASQTDGWLWLWTIKREPVMSLWSIQPTWYLRQWFLGPRGLTKSKIRVLSARRQTPGQAAAFENFGVSLETGITLLPGPFISLDVGIRKREICQMMWDAVRCAMVHIEFLLSTYLRGGCGSDT